MVVKRFHPCAVAGSVEVHCHNPLLHKCRLPPVLASYILKAACRHGASSSGLWCPPGPTLHVDSCRAVGWLAIDLPRYLVLHALPVTKITPQIPALYYHSSQALTPLARIFLIWTCKGGTEGALAARNDPIEATPQRVPKVGIYIQVHRPHWAQVPRLEPRGNAVTIQNNTRYPPGASRVFSAIQSYIDDNARVHSQRALWLARSRVKAEYQDKSKANRKTTITKL